MFRKNNRGLGSLLVALSALLIVSTAQAAPGGNPNSPLNDILAKLDAMQSDINTLKTQLTAVQRDVITCTARNKHAGLCDHVASTKAQACFELAVLKATIGGEWNVRVGAKAEGGAGWTTGPDGKILIDLKMPVAEVPSKFGLTVKPEVDLKGNICVEIPIDAQAILSGNAVVAPNAVMTNNVVSPNAALSDSQYEALAARFQEIAQSVVPQLMERIDSRMPTGSQAAAGVQAIEDLGNGDLMTVGGDLMSDDRLMQVAQMMPIPGTVRTALMNPAALRDRLPVLQGTLQDRLATLCDSSHGLSIVRSPLFAGAAGDACTYLYTVPAFDDIAKQLLDIPAATSALVDGLLNKTQSVVKNTSNWFCTKPLFKNTALCK